MEIPRSLAAVYAQYPAVFLKPGNGKSPWIHSNTRGLAGIFVVNQESPGAHSKRGCSQPEPTSIPSRFSRLHNHKILDVDYLKNTKRQKISVQAYKIANDRIPNVQSIVQHPPSQREKLQTSWKYFFGVGIYIYNTHVYMNIIYIYILLYGICFLSKVV